VTPRELLRRGVAENVFPLARLEVFHRGQHVLSEGPAGPETLFDLASVTKVMSTTALVLDQGLPLDAPVHRFLPNVRVEATLDDLLFHRSGLPAFLPFFDAVLRELPELFEGPQPQLRAHVREAVLARVAATEPSTRIGQQAVYSDLGFILLGAVLEAASGTALDALFTERIAKPLGLTAGYRRLSAGLPLPRTVAITGSTRPREPAPGQEGMWSVPSRPTQFAQVDDDNAWCLDGVSGHAGLFGTALDVARFGQSVLTSGRRWSRDGTPGSTRARGFDTPSDEGASCGPRFGRQGPLGAIGHLGFTGTSLWIDLDRELVVALLTNRVALGRANLRIRDFRPRLHEAVLDALHLG
jgi:CubicO group peptidase (beta-lactamase class C family)